MTSFISTLCSITLSASLTLGSTVALAAPAEDDPSDEESADDDESPEAVELSEQAVEKFQAKDYEGAIVLFEQAYAVDKHPKYLFNIGRVHEEAGNLEQAVQFYGKFVKQPGVDLDSREFANERLKVLREIIETTQEKPKDEPEDEPEEVADPVPLPEPVDEDGERKRKTMRGAGFGVLGVGAAAMIGGAVVGGLAQGDKSAADEAPTPAEDQTLREGSQSKALISDVLYGVGGALLLTGVILVAVGYTKPKTQRVALTPTFGPRGAGVDLSLRF